MAKPAEADAVEADAVEADDAAEDAAWVGAVKAFDDDFEPAGYPIKGNADSMLYHVPGSPFYDRTIAEVWFDTEEHAEAAGFQKPASQRADDETESEEG